MIVLIREEEEGTERYELPRLPCVIGRAGSCDLVIGHPSLGRRHCELILEQGLLFARDYGSTNGIGRNGRLRPGTDDELLLAKGDIFHAAWVALRVEGDVPDRAALEGMARDPGTPRERLALLGMDFPGAFLQNPVFPLLLLEEPGFLARQRSELLRALLGVERPPAPVLEAAAGFWDVKVRVQLARRADLPRELLWRLAADPKPDVQEAVVHHPHATKRILARLAAEGAPSIREAAAKRMAYEEGY
jgi:hypothetical protein